MSIGTEIRIGTRASALARTQTGWVVDRLREAGVASRIETIETRGDQRRDVPIAALGGDGLFVRELEQALLDGRIDAAVHSLKDVPTAAVAGLVLAAIPRRASPFDALVGRTAPRLEDLPAGARVGTSSVRRVMQLREIRPDVEAVPMRGNVDTRLRKLDAGEYDAVLLAAAGLERLGLAGRITQILEPPRFWPAVAQGMLAVQVRESDDRTRSLVRRIDDPDAHAAATAERRMLAELAGGCLAPIGGWARREGAGGLRLGGCVLGFASEGGRVARLVVEDVCGAAMSLAAADALGAAVAARLNAEGAADLLAGVRIRRGP
ncbi:MAG: hydroxymethylbilane synthase [Planctomycetaceae bacterium]